MKFPLPVETGQAWRASEKRDVNSYGAPCAHLFRSGETGHCRSIKSFKGYVS
jgi:hypothetical protein